jgi:hypothetical protein
MDRSSLRLSDGTERDDALIVTECLMPSLSVTETRQRSTGTDERSYIRRLCAFQHARKSVDRVRLFLGTPVAESRC